MVGRDNPLRMWRVTILLDTKRIHKDFFSEEEFNEHMEWVKALELTPTQLRVETAWLSNWAQRDVSEYTT